MVGQPTAEQTRMLIEQLLWNSVGPNGKVEVTYALPANVPITLPAGIEVVATMRVQYSGQANPNYRMIATSRENGAQLMLKVQQELLSHGWKRGPQGGAQVGFEGQYTPNYSNFYHEGQPNHMLNLNSFSRGSMVILDANISTIPDQQLKMMKQSLSNVPRSSLPFLTVLPGSENKTSYPVVGPSGAMSSIWVKTDRSAGEVFSHYSAQLKAAGWKALTDTTTGPLRVVTYAAKDLNGREALGTLGIRPWEKEGGYVLTVSVQGFKP